jgi:hypothetical protein
MAKAHELRLTGIVPIILTPFTADKQVDWRSLRRLVEFACAVSDLLAKVFQPTDRDMPAAYKILRAVLPQIAFSLQHMELFHHAEKGLMARCVLEGAIVRQLTLRLNEHLENHMSSLNRQVLALLDRLDLPHNPILATTAGKAGTYDRAVGARGWDQDRDRCRRRCATRDRSA